jgi:hypothetical protein
MNLWAKKDRLYIERHIQRAKKSQEKLRKWKQPVIVMDSTDPFIGYEHQVVVTVGNDQTNVLLHAEQRLAKKYPHNTTIVHMEKNGDYRVVFGATLDQIPKGDLKVMINGHGNSDGIGDRSVEEIAKHLGVINKAVGNDSETPNTTR